jgi:hypothetical protein
MKLAVIQPNQLKGSEDREVFTSPFFGALGRQLRLADPDRGMTGPIGVYYRYTAVPGQLNLI